MSDFLNTYELYHHGILGQKWGVKNGPPYPLKGSVIRNGHWHVSEKGNKDYTIKKGTVAQTLSYDKDRTKNADMYFAALSKGDKDFYNALFNKKIPNDEKDENGKRIGPAYYLKYAIKNEAKRDVKVANEKDGAKAFMNLMRSSKDFSNYVLDEKRMTSMIDDRRAKFKGYSEALDTVKKMRENPDKITAQDAAKAYRLFNYAIPNESPDAMRQRARFFKELKKEGYGAVLDTNDAIYGKFKMKDPVIVFDNDAMEMVSNERVKGYEKTISSIKSLFYKRDTNTGY